jgi:hypothetical protein
MSAHILDEEDRQLNYATLAALRGDDTEYDGPPDACPLCGPDLADMEAVARFYHLQLPAMRGAGTRERR